MKYILIMMIVLSGCKSQQSKQTGEYGNVYDDSNPIIIQVPQNTSKKNETSIFFNTQPLDLKIKVDSRDKYETFYGVKNGLKYEFFYGTGGRYIVRIKSLQGTALPYLTAETTMVVERFSLNDKEDTDPETISMASSESGVYSGFGSSRNGKIKITFDFYIPESKYNSMIQETMILSVEIKDIN